MMLLSLHVVAIGLLILVVGTLAYRSGYDKAERRYRRAMEHMHEDAHRAGEPTV